MCLCRYWNEDGLTTPILCNQLILRKLLLYTLDVCSWLINLVYCYDNINTCCLCMVNRLDCLQQTMVLCRRQSRRLTPAAFAWLIASIVCCNNKYSDISCLSTTHTHCCKCLMTWCIKECNILSIALNHISTDMLCNSAGLS